MNTLYLYLSTFLEYLCHHWWQLHPQQHDCMHYVSLQSEKVELEMETDWKMPLHALQIYVM